MSEQPISEEISMSPKDKAIAYIQYRDATRFGKEARKLPKGEKISSKLPLPKGEWKGVEVDLVTNYESVIDRLNDNGAKRALEGLRPLAYDTARLARWAAGVGEVVLGWNLFAGKINPSGAAGGTETWRTKTRDFFTTRKGRALGVIGTVMFRPVELAASGVAHVAGFVGREAYAPIMNAILSGGKPKELPKTA